MTEFKLSSLKPFVPSEQYNASDLRTEHNRNIHMVPLVPGTVRYILATSGLTRAEIEPALTDAIANNKAVFVNCFRREKLS